MDFQSLNRRELQSLCKLNKIPANITNVAMVDALKSLEIVVGFEEIEILSPKVPCTSYRTSTRKTVKKLETESLLATASQGSRGVRRQLTGEANEFPKTPSVIGLRKKGTTTSTRENTVEKETTVQRMYNTRRSARLTEKKCAEAGVTRKEMSQPVKISSFSEEVSVTSEESVGYGSSSVETSQDSYISSENTEKDNAGEGSVENYEEGISKEKVEDICIEFEKLDVVIVDGSDQSSVIEKADCCVKSLDLEEKQKVEEKFILNEPQISGEERDQVDDIKPDSIDNLNPCEDGDLEENMMVIDEKVDSHEALSVLVKEHDVYSAPEEQSSSLLCDKVLSGENSEKVDCCGENVELEEAQKAADKLIMNDPVTFEEKSDQVDNITPDSEGISYPCGDENLLKNMTVVDEKVDSYEELNVLVEEHMALEERSDNLLCDKVLSGESGGKVDCCVENGDLVQKQKVEDKFFLNEHETYKELNALVEEHMALEEHSDICIEFKKLDVIVNGKDQSSLIEMVDCCGENLDLKEKHKVEEKLILNEPYAYEDRRNQVDSIKPDSNDIFNSCDDVDSEENMLMANEKTNPCVALNFSVKAHDVYLASEENSSSLLCEKVLSGENNENVDCCDENVNLKEMQKVEEKFNLNELEAFEENSDQVDNIQPDSKGISNPCDDGDFEEHATVVDDKIEPHEALNVSVEEYLDPVEHSESLLSDMLLSEADGIDADAISCDTENSSDLLVSAPDMKNEVLECNSCTNDNENPRELLNLDNPDNHNVAVEVTAEPKGMEENITNHVDVALVNPNKQEPSKGLETPEESENSLIKQADLDIHQETEEK